MDTDIHSYPSGDDREVIFARQTLVPADDEWECERCEHAIVPGPAVESAIDPDISYQPSTWHLHCFEKAVQAATGRND